MPDSPSRHAPWWETPPPTFPRLAADIEADVVIVGAGYAGLTAAYLLADPGRSVVVLDQHEIGHGMSGHTTAHHTVLQDRRFVDLASVHDEPTAIAYGRAHHEAIDVMERIIGQERIDCQFTRVEAYLADSAGDLKGDRLRDEARLAGQAEPDGARTTEALDRIDIAPFEGLRGLRVTRQARTHAGRYLAGLADACTRRGVRIMTHTTVRSHREHAALTEDGHTVRARVVLLCTHVPPAAKELATKMTPNTTYAIAARVPRGAVHDALYYDTDEPYHYVRLQPMDDHDLLIVGGEDHRVGVPGKTSPDARHDNLETWARQRFPDIDEVTHRWNGIVFVPHDGMPFIGRAPGEHKDLFVATGFSGNGTTNGTIAGVLLAALVKGEEHPWERLFDPGRRTSLIAREFLSHNLDAAKHLVGSRLTPHRGPSVEDLEPGTGAVVGIGPALHAIYKHEDGRIEEHSAVCTHLRCIVEWNQAATAFECACHGSRFAPDGKVLAGPATAPLAPVGASKKTAVSEESPR